MNRALTAFQMALRIAGASSPVLLIAALVAVLALVPVSHPATASVVANVVNSLDDDEDEDDAECTLREAIVSANTNTASGPGVGECIGGITNEIDFDIDGCPPACTIQPTVPLPNITRDSTQIDGTSEPDYDGTPLVTVDGSVISGTIGLRFDGNDGLLDSLVVQNFPHWGVWVTGAGVEITDNVIDGNGTVNNGGGIIAQTAGPGLTVTGNTISNNTTHGIDSWSDNAVVSDNTFDNNGAWGVNLTVQNPAATLTVQNNVVTGSGVFGMLILDGASPTITGNTIDDTHFLGMSVAADGAIVSGNTVTNSGADVDSTTGVGINLRGDNITVTNNVASNNLGSGIAVRGIDVQVGGTGPGDGNTLTANGDAGVLVRDDDPQTLGVSILGNSIFGNGGLGIEHEPDGVEVNDDLDADTGPNRLQNFPELTEATTENGLTVAGVINTVPDTPLRIELFGSDECDPSDHGEGQFYLGFVVATTDGAGDAAFETSNLGLPDPGSFITSTATNLGTGDTSEFSACLLFGAVTSPTATPTPGPTSTGTPAPTATPTPVPTGEPQLAQGDNDCDGDTDSVDALKGLQHLAAINFSQEPGCPALGGALPAAAPAGDPPDVFGDVDCDNDIDAVDALKILRNLAALSVSQNEPCTNIGEPL